MVLLHSHGAYYLWGRERELEGDDVHPTLIEMRESYGKKAIGTEMVRRGYVVISIDNRGTKTPQGREWRKSIYGQIGILASFDQMAAVEKILKTYDFIDSSRVGSWGWSGGGQMTLNLMFRFPEILWFEGWYKSCTCCY